MSNYEDTIYISPKHAKLFTQDKLDRHFLMMMMMMMTMMKMMMMMMMTISYYKTSNTQNKL